MARFFDFYDALERRYIFNSFLVVVGLVEVLILVFTLIWQIDEGVFAQQVEQVRVVPFPWKEYLLAAFTAPIALLFLFGLIVQGFELICREAQAPGQGPREMSWAAKMTRPRYLLGLLALLLALVFLFRGGTVFPLITNGVKALGLGGSYLVIAVLALALLYLPLRLLLRYRLQKKALEYQYLQSIAERHGVLVVDPRLHPEPANSPGEKKNASGPAISSLPSPPDPQEEPGSH